jgi:serine/threonine-protein kinase
MARRQPGGRRRRGGRRAAPQARGRGAIVGAALAAVVLAIGGAWAAFGPSAHDAASPIATTEAHVAAVRAGEPGVAAHDGAPAAAPVVAPAPDAGAAAESATVVAGPPASLPGATAPDTVVATTVAADPVVAAPAPTRPATAATPTLPRATATAPRESAKDRRTREAREREARDNDAKAAAARALPPATGTVKIAISPWGLVEVDGAPSGAAPPITELALSEGRHQIVVRNGDFAPYTASVNVIAGQTVSLRHKFGS